MHAFHVFPLWKETQTISFTTNEVSSVGISMQKERHSTTMNLKQTISVTQNNIDLMNPSEDDI